MCIIVEVDQYSIIIHQYIIRIRDKHIINKYISKEKCTFNIITLTSVTIVDFFTGTREVSYSIARVASKRITVAVIS